MGEKVLLVVVVAGAVCGGVILGGGGGMVAGGATGGKEAVDGMDIGDAGSRFVEGDDNLGASWGVSGDVPGVLPLAPGAAGMRSGVVGR